MLGKSSKPRSSKGPSPFDFGGVGLGIVAALEKPSDKSLFLFARNLSRSDPLPVKSATAPFRLQSNSTRGSVFHISPAKIGEVAGVPPPDFLSACNLCRKGLHGVDIYMYRGEKAFCSPECRYREMAMDERAEKCSSSASSPNYAANGQILTNGILAI